MMMSSTACSSSCVGRALVEDERLPDDEHAVGQAEHLRDLAGHDDDGDPVVGEPADRGRRSRSGPRRRRRGWARRAGGPGSRGAASGPGRPSAGCRRRGCATSRSTPAGRTSSVSSSSSAGSFSPSRSSMPPREKRVRLARLMLGRATVAEHERLALALLGAQADAGGDGRRHRPGAQPRARRRSPCRSSPCGAPKTVSTISERPEPTSPASPTTSPGAHVEGDVRELARAGRGPRRAAAARRRRRPRGWAGRRTRSSGRSCSRMSSGVGVVLAGEAGGHRAAVLEHGDPVADLADLLEAVRDVDDGDALRR